MPIVFIFGRMLPSLRVQGRISSTLPFDGKAGMDISVMSRKK